MAAVGPDAPTRSASWSCRRTSLLCGAATVNKCPLWSTLATHQAMMGQLNTSASAWEG
jgi:hypothetical protein